MELGLYDHSLNVRKALIKAQYLDQNMIFLVYFSHKVPK
jgi:hypothetical protein